MIRIDALDFLKKDFKSLKSMYIRNHPGFLASGNESLKVKWNPETIPSPC